MYFLKMFFLWKLMVLCYFSAFQISAAEKLTLDASSQRINPLTSDSYTLNCTYEGKGIRIWSIRIMKENEKRSRGELLAVLYNNTPKIRVYDSHSDVDYSGSLTTEAGNTKAAMSVKWSVVPRGLGGFFTCMVYKKNSQGKSILLGQKDIRLVEEKVDFEHAVTAIQKLHRFTEDLRQELASDRATTSEYRYYMSKGLSLIEGVVLKNNSAG